MVFNTGQFNQGVRFQSRTVNWNCFHPCHVDFLIHVRRYMSPAPPHNTDRFSAAVGLADSDLGKHAAIKRKFALFDVPPAPPCVASSPPASVRLADAVTPAARPSAKKSHGVTIFEKDVGSGGRSD